jgi:hypothetical protein
MEQLSNYNFKPTTIRGVYKLVNRNGDWEFYYRQGQYLPSVNHTLHMGYAKGSRFYQYLLSVSKEEADRKLSQAGERGSRVHQAINTLIAGGTIDTETRLWNDYTNRHEPLTVDEWDCLIAFSNWVEDYKPRTIASEFTVYNVQENYAGQADYLCVIDVPFKDEKPRTWSNLRGAKPDIVKQKVILLDWKTSAGIWDEMKAQTAAYRKGKGGPVSRYKKEPVYTGVVRLNSAHTRKYEFKIWTPEESEQHFELFRAAERIRYESEGDFTPTFVQIPSQFKVEIPLKNSGKK